MASRTRLSFQRLNTLQLEDRVVPARSLDFVGPLAMTADGRPVQLVKDEAPIVPVQWMGRQEQMFAGEWIARFEGIHGYPTVQMGNIQLQIDRLDGFGVVSHLGADGLVLLRVPTNLTHDEVVTRLRSVAQVDNVTPNQVVHATLIPNDTDFSKLYAMLNTGQTINGVPGVPGADISATKAWDISLGNSKVVMGVIDTGVAINHPDLKANIYVNPGEIPGNGIDDDSNGFIDDVNGWNFVANTNNPDDDHYHGTHCAGTVAGVGQNNQGVIGVAPNVTILPIKFLNSGGSGSIAGAISSVNYANKMYDTDKTHIFAGTSNSWGGGGADVNLETAIAGHGLRDMLFIAAAGNHGGNNDSVNFLPASYPQDCIISVAASTNQDGRAGFSAYGLNSVDIAAPGVDIWSTALGGSYKYLSGTSMATPHVSGAIALMRSIMPGASYTVLRDALYNSGDDIAAFSKTGSTPIATGKRINVFNALNELGMQIVSTTPEVGSVVGTAPTVFDLNFNRTVDAKTVQISDLKVNGQTATSVVMVDFDTVRYTFGTSPVTTQGLQTMTVAEGAFADDKTGDLSKAFTGTFRYDTTILAITSTNPPASSLVTLPFTLLDLHLNEPVLPSSVATSDFSVSQGSVSGFLLLNGDKTIRLTLMGMGTEGPMTVSVAAGALTDVFTNPNLAFSATYELDFKSRAFPTPLVAVNPLGNRTYQGTITGLINNGTDVDDFTLTLDPDQTLSLTVTPVSSLQPRVQVIGPGNTVLVDQTASAKSQSILVPPTAIDGGNYTVRVSSAGGSSGSFTLQALLNAATEAESIPGGNTNNTAATAESLAPATITTITGPSTFKRAQVLGRTDTNTGYVVTTPAFEFEDISTTGTTVLVNVDDNPQALINFGFDFTFFNVLYNSAYISSNGLITFGSGTGAYINTDLTTSPTQPTIAAYWDDLYTGADGIKWQVLGSGSDQRLVVQWHNLRYYDGGSNTLVFEAILYQASGKIRYNFQNLSNGAAGGHDEGKSATVGIKNGGGLNITLAFNNGPNEYVGSGKSVLFTPQSPGSDYYSFPASGGETVSVAVNGLAAGSLGVQLYGTDGTTLLAKGSAVASNFTSGIMNFVLPGSGPGTYFVAVSGGSLVPYGLTVTTNSAFDAESNDSASTAQPLGNSRGVTGHISVGDNDWFALTMPAGMKTLTLESSTPGDGPGEFINGLNPLIRVYDASGTTLLGIGKPMPDGRNETLTVNDLVPGASYRIRISGEADGLSGEYTLGIQTSSGATPIVGGFTVNNGDAQRSRITTLTVNFTNPVDLAQFQTPGAVTLTRLPTSLVGVPLGHVVDTTNGLIVSPASGMANSITLTFANIVNAGVNSASLADGRWQLAIPAAGFTSNDTILNEQIRRLFGDGNGDGIVDGTDFGVFGSAFGGVDPVFDFDNNSPIDGTDFSAFGARFGLTI